MVTWKKGQKSGNSDIEGWAVQCHNCIEFSGISNTINVNKLEEIIIEACKDININVSEMDIEACHRLPVRCNSGNIGKTVIIKFLNCKHVESSLSKKFPLSSTNIFRLNINNNKLYVNTSLRNKYWTLLLSTIKMLSMILALILIL